jgi:hypothetical protein
MKTVSVFSPVLGLCEMRGQLGGYRAISEGYYWVAPLQTPDVPYLDPRCPLSRPLSLSRFYPLEGCKLGPSRS